MELPKRAKNDVYTRPGQYLELQTAIQRRREVGRIPALVVYAFDYRTRLGPYLFIDKSLIPGGPRAVASALYACGFEKLRVVLQQWSPNVRPSRALIDGERPELLFVSSMQIHSRSAYELVADAYRLGDERPLILAGGAKAIYEPWDFFALGPEGRYNADVVVTGEEYVILELFDRILAHRAAGETMRHAFHRVRREGLLEDIPGLVYRGDEQDDGPPEYLVNTGIQRLVQDLDELPEPFDAMGLFEPPHRRRTLARRAIPAEKLGRYAQVLSVVTTHGCKFRCSYCPIPAYNQFTFRYRSPERLVHELGGVFERTGIGMYFGTDDNFFNNRETVEEIFTAMARGRVGRKSFRDVMWFGTEATEFDVDKNRDLLPLARDGGLRAIWFGIEDMTAELVKKGQSPEKTRSVFGEMRRLGIAPMPMMMHHDGQPLWSWRNLYGLLNQVRFLRRVGACSIQVTFLTPSVGSKGYETPFESGMVMDRVGGVPVEDYQFDGNHCIATQADRPWRKQLNVFLGYAAFYNPVNLVRAAAKLDSLWTYRVTYQLYGTIGVLRSLWEARDWMSRLVRGPITRAASVPSAKIAMVIPEPVQPDLVHYGLGLPRASSDAAATTGEHAELMPVLS